MNHKYRYPGAPSFQKEDAHIFFGRDKETAELLRLIRLEQMIVLYGKSGLGKTSLLNAGVLPQLEALSNTTEEAPTYYCMKARFFAWKDDTSQSPLATFRRETVEQQSVHPLLKKMGITVDDLWYGFKSLQLSQAKETIFVLVFDQFEELFTYPEVQIEQFKQALAQLLHASMPADFKQALRANAAALSKEEKTALLQAVQIKVVLSVRSDRLSLLDKMTDYLPNALVNLYELKPLSRTQAKAAIVEPAQQEGRFDTPTFSYTPIALTAMLTHLEDDNGKIEPFQIQYLCEHSESIIQKTGLKTLDATDLGDLSQLFNNYYSNKIADLGTPANQRRARRLLEDGLLFNEIRLSLLEAQITDKRGFGVSLPLLRRLENVRLIRAERREDQTYYEITHDTLIAPILEAKQERQKKERRRRTLVVGGLAILALVGALSVIFFVLGLYETANDSKQRALLALKEIESQSDLIKAQNDSIINSFAQLQLALAKADTATSKALAENERFRKSNSTYLMSEAQKAFERDDSRLAYLLSKEALKYFPENIEAKKLLKQIGTYFATYFRDSYSSGYSYSSDGEFLAFFTDISDNSGTLQVLNLETRKTIHFPNSYSDSYSYSYSPDNKFLTFFTEVSDNSGTLQALNLETGKTIHFPNTYRNSNRDSYSYSPDNKFLTFFTEVSDNSGTLQVLSLKTGKTIHFPNSYRDRNIYRDSYSPDDKFLTFFTEVSHDSRTLQVLNLETGKTIHFPNSYPDHYRYSSDNKFLTFFTDVSFYNGTLQVLNLETGKTIHFPDSYPDRYSYSYSPDNRFLTFFTEVSDNSGTLQVLNLEIGKTIHFPNSYSYSYSYSSDNKFLTFFTEVSDNSGTLQVLNLETGKTIHFPNSYRNSNRDSYSYSPDNKFLTLFTEVSDNSGTLQILSLETGKTIHFPNSYRDRNSHRDSYSYSPDNKFLTFFTEVSHNSGTLQVLNLETGKTIHFPNSYSYGYSSIDHYRYSSNNKFLTFFTDVSFYNGTLQVLNLETGKTIHFPNSYRDRNSYSYSPDNKFLTFFTKVSDNSGTLQVLNLETGKTIHFPNSYRDRNSYSYSPDDRFLTFFTDVSDNGGTLQILNLETGKTIHFPNSYSYSYSYSYSSDDGFLTFLQTNKRTVHLFDLQRQKVIRTISHQYEIEKIEFSPDNQYLTTFSKYPGSSTRGILKFTPVFLRDEDVFTYYTSRFTPLSTSERE